MEIKIREAYKKFFNDEIDFVQLAAELNLVYRHYTNRSYIIYLTPQLESQFYSNISKSLYPGRKI